MLQIVHTPASSNISRFGWNGNLYIEFKSNGKVYEYPNVTEVDFDALCQAPSVGEFFHARIKKVYQCAPIPVEAARALGFEEVVQVD